ncbi:hypothetical protein BJX99DRAFT_272464 [Aspergillus californicus]
MPVQRKATGRNRRQNHSCDQCRKSKRACDALCLDLIPCSYCSRTKKRCTMNWAQSRAQSSGSVLVSTRKSPRNLYDDGLGHGDSSFFSWTPSDFPVDTGYDVEWTADDLLLEPDLFPPQDAVALESADVDMSGFMLDWDCGSSMVFDSVLGNGQRPKEGIQTDLSDLLQLDGSSISDICNQQSTDLACNDVQSILPLNSQSSPRRRQRQFPMDRTPSLSPSSLTNRMISKSTSTLTSANLLQIYHDVLEHNLSCWLTEVTCPYYKPTSLPTTQNTVLDIPEIGSSWSNRIYQRTIKLDRAAQACKLIQLSHTETQDASRALHLAIMAFATQWAQGSFRQRERYPNTSVDGCGSEERSADNIIDEFDRTLQNHFWEQAKSALNQVANVECYRVACAELIFGLTQPPCRGQSQTDTRRTESPAQNHIASMDTIVLQIGEIIREGPPTYMESAARKMHALKYRCDALDRGLGNKGGSLPMGHEDRGTISLLYWLAIMFDTVSSSMNERPVVVLDEECQHERLEPSRSRVHRSRWDLDHFVPGGFPEETHKRTYWPCSYKAAAEDVVKAAPVKVLLFRHISYLQNAVRKGQHGPQIEEIISSTIALYRYWNKTHGAFFRDLVQDYRAVPQRIQGWFVCISAHWHLAALMLADLLDFIDGNGLGMQDPACARCTGKMAMGIRMHSAAELADLAKVATPSARENSLGVLSPQMSEFHHVVNEGTLLTEPWTIILIRAFTKACVIFLADAERSLYAARTTLGSDTGVHDAQRVIEQAEDCIKGLWLLGKKSDMARKIADTLSLGLGGLRNSIV